MLNIEIEKADGVLRATLSGRLNNLTSKEFSQRIQAESEGVHRVELDFANLEYISSAGLRILLAIQEHMESVGGESVCVYNATEMVRDTLEMTGFWGVINVE